MFFQPDETATPVPIRLPMALALGQQQQQQLAQAATLEHLKERLERGTAAAADAPEKKMMRLAEEQQRLMQQALQQNLLAMASQFNPMNLKLTTGHGELQQLYRWYHICLRKSTNCFFYCFPTENKQDLSLNISNNGTTSISVSVGINGTIYAGKILNIDALKHSLAFRPYSIFVILL